MQFTFDLPPFCYVMKVLLVSAVIPDNTGGGQLLLQRHLLGEPAIELALALPVPWLGPECSFVTAPNALWRRLGATRFNVHVQLLRDRLGATCGFGPLLDFARGFAPDAVLTIAHGPMAATAHRLAHRLGRPLATVFHDWWPDLAPRGMGYTKMKFRKLYQASHTAFCVSEGMRRELGPHEDAPILLPIPGPAPSVASGTGPSNLFTVVYTGSLNDVYRTGMEELSRLLQDHPFIRLELWGDAGEWPTARREALRLAGIYRGSARNDDPELRASLTRAGALLTHLSFAVSHERRVRTSFPSKLIDYTRWAKPLVLWGPPYSSAAEWLRPRASAVVVEDPSPASVVSALESLAENREQQRSLSDRAAHLYHGEVSPSRLQQIFLDGFARCAASSRL